MAVYLLCDLREPQGIASFHPTTFPTSFDETRSSVDQAMQPRMALKFSPPTAGCAARARAVLGLNSGPPAC